MVAISLKEAHRVVGSHYFVHGGWFEQEEYILDNVDKIRHIPGVILQGRYNMVTPMRTAWQLHKVCSKVHVPIPKRH